MGLNPKLWQGKKVLVTGHTGFKGSWLTLLLKHLGADIVGVSLPPQGARSLYIEGCVGEALHLEYFQDIRDEAAICKIITDSNVDYVFHLAAQAYVRRSIRNPHESIMTNIVGTSNVLMASLASNSILGLTIVTTDKVYENLGTNVPFKESDKLGGQDVYSASKAAVEVIVSAIASTNNPSKIPITTVRAGNVIGGGDWGEERLIPDLVRTFYSNQPLQIRNPLATRPWQYVLDCLYGYLLVAQTHLEKQANILSAVNFGPEISMSVLDLVLQFEKSIGKEVLKEIVGSTMYESPYLTLDSSLAQDCLGWKPSLTPNEAIELTADWYSRYLKGDNPKDLMDAEILKYKVGKW